MNERATPARKPRAPRDRGWRIDGGDWHRIAPTQLSRDMTELSMWMEIGWLDGGILPLTAGPHTLEIRATEWNVQLIKSIPEEYLGKLGAAVGEAWEQGRRWEDIAAVLDHVGDVTESRVEIIARDQTAKMTSAFSRVRMLDVGINRYQWIMFAKTDTPKNLTVYHNEKILRSISEQCLF